jgi:hypothetical protein
MVSDCLDSDPSTVSESISGDSLRRSACHTSNTTQTNAVRSLRNWARLHWQSTINGLACGQTPRSHRGRLVGPRGGSTAAHLATATSTSMKMTTKSPYSSNRSAPARRWRPYKRSLQRQAQLIIRGLTTKTYSRLMMRACAMSQIALLANAQLQINTTRQATTRGLLSRYVPYFSCSVLLQSY